jgi:serine/threonine protein kinase
VSYKVQDAQTGRFYSLKTLPPEAAKSQEIVKRFWREIEIVTKLDHPNLIAGIDAGERNGVPYLITEHVVGTDLATLVKSQGALPVPMAIDYIVQAARGLTQLHLHGVYHRNLKPQSLLVDLQGRLKVSNLMMARVDDRSELAHDDELTRQGTLLGSADFLSPEQAEDAHSADGRSDIYALGCVLHFLLLGRPPYPAKSLMEKLKSHKLLPVPNMSAVRPNIPAHVQQVFQQMLAKNPDNRPQFVADIIDALCPRDVAAEVEKKVNLGLVIGGGVALVVVLGVTLGIVLSR